MPKARFLRDKAGKVVATIHDASDPNQVSLDVIPEDGGKLEEHEVSLADLRDIDKLHTKK
jgi:hypothetical protein